MPKHVRGDRWPGLTLGPILVDGAAPATTLARVRMHFKKGTSVYKLDTDATDRDTAITITNATTWVATVPEIESGFLTTSGTWTFDIEFYGTGQGSSTLVTGDIRVLEDVTT